MTDLTGYHLVLASTEEALNNSLEYSNISKVTITAQLRPGNSDRVPGLYGARISAPTIRLSGSDLASNQASVTVQFTSGTLQHKKEVGIGIDKEDVTGWTLVFASSIGQGAIPTNADTSQLPEAVQQALTNAALSVGQLFLELTTVNWASAPVYDSNGDEVPSLSATTLQDALKMWARNAESAAQQWVLNYVITSSDGSGNGGSGDVLTDLVPTSYNFSITQYNPAGDYDDLSTLNYLMMTDGSSAPTANSAGVFDNNWVEGPNTQEYQGTVAVDGTLFNKAYVESQLLPAIATAVGAAKAQITNQGAGTWTISQSVDLYGNENDGKGQKKEGLGVQKVFEDIVERLNCTVTLDPSTATYNVSGSYYAKSTITLEWVGWDATDSSFWKDYELPWSFSIQIKAGSNGTLVAESSSMKQGSAAENDGGDSIPGDILNFISNIFTSFLNTYSKQFQDQAASISQDDFSKISDQLQTTMGDISSSVVFPAGNRFAYKDVNFDSDQNLVAYLTYLS